MNTSMPDTGFSSELSPFGAPTHQVKSITTRAISAMYLGKCNVDISEFFGGISKIQLFECVATGLLFWRPIDISGPEKFYRLLSESWPNYYREERWEYSAARDAIGAKKRILEVGCGQGFFLKSIETDGNEGIGLELNEEAIQRKVTRFDVRKQFVDEIESTAARSFDVVCSFQVLEHVANPAAFIRSCANLAKRGGLIIISTPNHDYRPHREMTDAFDLPPHHMNHFDGNIFKRIADFEGLELVAVHEQKMQVPRISVEIDPRGSRIIRRARRMLNSVLLDLAGTMEVPGHSLMVILRVKGD